MIAYPKTWKLSDLLPLSGKIIIGANSRRNRRNTKFVLVKVKTNINGTVNTGSFGATEKRRLKNTLYQAYIYAQFENGPILDLTTDVNFKIQNKPTGKVYGKFIYKESSPADPNIDGGIYEDFNNT